MQSLEKIHLGKQFALRLKDALIAAGFDSQRSPYGVYIQKLATIADCSLQICRKYLKGEVLPEPRKLIIIAQKLNVSPGWLLFGELSNTTGIDSTQITIKKNLLHSIFSNVKPLCDSGKNMNEVADFFIDLSR